MKLINHHFKIKNHIINNDKEVNARIVLLADIHYSSSFKKEKKELIINKLKSLKPDYICIPGDIVDHKKVLEDENLKKELLAFLEEIAKVAKTYVSIGNHEGLILLKRKFKSEIEYKENKEWLEEIKKVPNLYLLDNELAKVDSINFVGVTLSYSYYLKENQNKVSMVEELKEKIPKLDNKYNILLIHSPIHLFEEENFKELETKNIDLVLSGHTHNGVVPPILDEILRGNRGIYSPNGRWFLKAANNRGVIHYKDKTMIINGSITKIHECSPKWMVYLNELFPMSIDVIDLKNKEN